MFAQTWVACSDYTGHCWATPAAGHVSLVPMDAEKAPFALQRGRLFWSLLVWLAAGLLALPHAMQGTMAFLVPLSLCSGACP